MKKLTKNILITICSMLLLFIILAVSYVIYMNTTYYRIKDNLLLKPKNNQNATLKTNTDYSVLTYNIGFGAYDQDYSFFMDTGTMKDGTPVKGKSSRGSSKENVLNNTNGSVEIIKKLSTDFTLLQEVDLKATRSYVINQKETIENALSNYASVFTLNFHSPYMIYPFNEPHGSVKSGLLTLSKYKIDSATRISYPIDTSFFTKFFDLDRCFTITRYEVSNGKELVLINNHMSAYDKGGKIRAKQLEVLNKTMKNEYDKGNYVIVGGDFNHALNIDDDTFPSEQLVPDWVYTLTNKNLPQGLKIVNASNNTIVPTCRTADIPYEKGVNYTTVIDGFIVSDNVIATAENINANFMYSDHNPVKLTFKLQ